MMWCLMKRRNEFFYLHLCCNILLSNQDLYIHTYIYIYTHIYTYMYKYMKMSVSNLMLIGPCIIAVVDEWKTNLMSLTILFHLLCAQHVSDINMSIFRSLRLCWWITTSVVLFSVRCVLELLVRLVFRWFSTVVLQPAKRTPSKTNRTNCSNTQRTENKTTDVVIHQTQSQAHDDGHINVRNMLST